MKLTTNFELREFIHPHIYEKIGDRSADFLNGMLAQTCQDIRDIAGETTINDWLWGGEFKNSGLRLPKGMVGAELSAHRFGCAADLKFLTTDPLEIQKMILENKRNFPYITRMENAEITKTWLHIETSINKSTDIHVFNP